MPAEHEGFVAVLVIDLHFPEAGSLKGKRHELRPIRDGLRARFRCAVAETGFQDLWQRGRLVAALTGGSLPVLEGAVEELERWLQERCPAGVRIERLLVSVADLVDVVSTVTLGG